MSEEYQFLKNFKPKTVVSASMGKAMDTALASLRDTKGPFWAELIQYATVSKLSTLMMDEKASEVIAHAGGKLLYTVLTDKYGEASVGDKMQELMDDADVVIKAIAQKADEAQEQDK